MSADNRCRYEMPHYTEYDLISMDKETIVWAYCLLQDKFEHLRDCEYVDMEERLRIMTVRSFGRSSEKTRILTGSGKSSKNASTGSAGTDNDDKPNGNNQESGKESSDKKNQKGHPVRTAGCADKVTRNLPVVDEDIELTPEELESIFGPNVKYIDDPNFEKTYEEVCTIPCSHYVVRYHIHVYRGGGKIVQAANVEKMKKGSIQTPDLMAEITNDRCVLQLPMNRIAQELSREGFCLTRQTMARWSIDFGTDFLAPMIFRMFDRIIETGYMQADETPIIVGRKPDGSRQECRQWVFRTVAMMGGHQIIVFYFDETRSTDVLRELLRSLKKKLTIICDSYISYKSFAKEMEGLVTIANCLTHSRRKFSDIIKAIPGFKGMSDEEKKQVLSYRIIKMMDEIFENERNYTDMDAGTRLERRIAENKPIMDRLIDMLKAIPASDFDKSSKLYEAVNYIVGQEENFRVFLKDGNVPVHNSSCEQAIIPFALGRNGWKSIDSIDGAITLGYYYSITETAKANGANPFYYLKFIFEKLPALFKRKNGKPDPKDFDELMPWTESYRSYESGAVENNHKVLIRLGKISRSANST